MKRAPAIQDYFLVGSLCQQVLSVMVDSMEASLHMDKVAAVLGVSFKDGNIMFGEAAVQAVDQKASSSCEELLQITATGISGDTLAVVNVHSCKLVSHLKQQISELALDVPASQQHLLFDNAVLEDEKVLAEYGLHDRATVQVLLVHGPVTLNGRPIKPVLHGAKIQDDTIILGRNKYFEIPASVLGDWGCGDFSLEMTVEGKKTSKWKAEGGVLFTRSDEKWFPFTGPAAFLYCDGQVIFQMKHDQGRRTHRMETKAGACKSGSGFPRLVDEHHILFEKKDSRLTITIDGVEQERLEIQNPVDGMKFTSAPLIFGGSHVNPVKQSIPVILKRIILTGS